MAEPTSNSSEAAMQVSHLHCGALSVLDFRCCAGPHTPTAIERHDVTSVSHVRRGSFGYRARGEEFELVAGSVLVGYGGDESVCTHDHHQGDDECLRDGLPPARRKERGRAVLRRLQGNIQPTS